MLPHFSIDRIQYSPQGPPNMEVFPSFSLNIPTFLSISQQIQQIKPIPLLTGKKGMTFTFDFLQSHAAISANFARIDKNLVPINQGKSILF